MGSRSTGARFPGREYPPPNSPWDCTANPIDLIPTTSTPSTIQVTRTADTWTSSSYNTYMYVPISIPSTLLTSGTITNLGTYTVYMSGSAELGSQRHIHPKFYAHGPLIGTRALPPGFKQAAATGARRRKTGASPPPGRLRCWVGIRADRTWTSSSIPAELQPSRSPKTSPPSR